MEKRGQLTMFIIIGLILLVSASIVVYLTTQKVVKPVEEEVIVPENIRPVYEFVQACTQDIAKEGIGLLGLQGGFIQLPGIIDRTPTAYIPADTMNVIKVPLWYYEGEDRTPNIGFMEREISRHLNQNLKDCTGTFEAFGEQFRVVEEGNVSTKTIIVDNEVLVRITWPLAITSGERTTRIKDFVVRLPVKLKQIWQLANATMSAENEKNLFEEATIDLMAADQEKIPLDGFTIECGVKRWRISEIQDRLETLLYYNIPTARVAGTYYFPFSADKSTYDTLDKEYQRMTKELEQQDKILKTPKIDAPDDAFSYFKLFFDVGVRASDLMVGFEFQPSWGMQLNAQPNEGPVLKSNTGRGAGKFLRFMCMNQWHFTYDIIYPVKVTIRDEQAFGGEGFLFQFGFPVLINDNAAERVAFGYRRFQSLDFGSPEFCTTYGNTLYDIRALGAVEGVPVLMELPDAQVTFKCFDQECDLGKTSAEGGIYRVNTYLPRGCAHPFITVSKEGYLETTKQLLTDRLDVELKKLQDMKLKFVVHPYHGPTQTWGQTRELKKDERVSLQVNVVNATFDQFVGWPTTNETVQVVQDTAYYDIDAMLYLRNNPIGGYNAETLRIPFESVAGKDTVIIHLVEYLPTSITDEQRMNMMSFLMDGTYRDALRPEFE